MTRVVRGGTRIDASTVEGLRAELRAAVAAGDTVVELSAVQFFDAVGLAMLLGVHRHAGHAGHGLTFRGTPPRLARVLGAVRLHHVLRPAAALAAASGAGPGAVRVLPPGPRIPVLTPAPVLAALRPGPVGATAVATTAA